MDIDALINELDIPEYLRCVTDTTISMLLDRLVDLDDYRGALAPLAAKIFDLIERHPDNSEEIISLVSAVIREYQDATAYCGACSNRGDADQFDHDTDMCADCYNEYYGTCSGCECTFTREDLNEDDLCSDCGHVDMELGSADIYSYSDSKRFDWKPHISRSENLGTLMGIELEIENFSGSLSALQRHINYSALLAEDGSLDSSGFEIIIKPTDRTYQRNELKIKDFLAFLRASGATSYESGNCGLHVHLARTNFRCSNYVEKLCWFFYKNRYRLSAFSKRGSLASEKGYKYCAFPASPERYRFTDRYTCVNFEPQHTVELRFMRGTLNYTRFLAALQFADMLPHYINDVSLTNLQRNTRPWNDLLAYIRLKNRWNHLLKYLDHNV